MARWSSTWHGSDRRTTRRTHDLRRPVRRRQHADSQFRLRDVVRAIDGAKDDAHVKAVVLDLDSFGGGYPAALSEVASAIGRVRASGKPVLAYATAYTDGGYRLAAASSEVWMNPLGGTLFMGPGGTTPYYKGLIDKLGIDVHVYRVGKFKSFVEPYTRADQSPEAKEASQALYGTLFADWQAAVAKARPKAQIAPFVATPDKAILATNGDIAQANLAAGIVDKLGDRTAFGDRVAAIVGADPKTKAAGSFASIKYQAWLDANPLPTAGDAIGVLTVAGDIVDGHAGPGSAAGDTIEAALFKGLAKDDLKALVIRVDSPGGSVLASEKIRLAILQAKKKGLPVVVSMGGLAASGWLLGLDHGRRDLCRAVDDHRIDRHLRDHPDVREVIGEDRRDRGRGAHHAAVRPARRVRGDDADARHRPAGGDRERLPRIRRPRCRRPAHDAGAGRTRSARAGCGTAAPRTNWAWSTASAR